MDQATTMVGLWEWDPASGQDWIDSHLAECFQEMGAAPPGQELSLLALLDAPNRNRLLSAAREAWNSGSPLRESLVLSLADGSTRRIFMQGGRSVSENVTRLIVACHVETHRPDEDNSELRSLLNSGLVDAFPVLIVVINPVGELQHVNRRVEQLLGIELPMLKGCNWITEFLDPGDHPQVRGALAQAISNQPGKPQRTRIRSASGSIHTIEWSYVPERQGQGADSRIVGIGIDISQQDHAEQQLRLKQRVLEQSLNGIVIADMSARLTYVNRAFLDLLGYSTAEEVLGRSALEFCTDQALGLSVLEDIKAGKTWSGELTVVRKDGSPIDMLLSATLIRDERGAPQWMLASHLDITARKRQEQALRTSEASLKLSQSYLRAVFDSSPECIKVLDKDCRVIDMNQAGILALEVESLDQIRGADMSQWVAPEDREKFRSAVKAACSGERTSIVFRLISARGACRWMEQHAVGLVTRAGTPCEQMVSVCRDITERLQFQNDQAAAQAALRESEARLQLLLKYAPASVVMLDRDLKYIAYSQRWLDDNRLEGQELLGRSHYEVLPEIPQRWKDIHQRCLNGAIERCERDIFQRADGTVSWVRWKIQPWRDAEGEIGGLVFFTEDVSKDVQAEEEVQSLRNQVAHAGRIATMGEMAAGIAHELNQPLAAISLYAEGCASAAQAGTLTHEELTAKFTEIAALANRCGEIIRRLRNFATKRHSQRSPLDLRDVLTCSLELLRHEYRIAGIDCRLTLPADPCWLIADSTELQQVFINILRNALEATTSKPDTQLPVEVTLACTSSTQCCVAVRDYGVGIPPEQLPQLFTPFFTTKSKGLGIGLKICATIIQSYGGEIECRPAVGGGTEFLVHLPLTQLNP
jgi:PAS domain S-box-containing protein